MLQLNSKQFITIGVEKPQELQKNYDITLKHCISHYHTLACPNLSKLSLFQRHILAFKIPKEINGEINFAKKQENDDFGFIQLNQSTKDYCVFFNPKSNLQTLKNIPFDAREMELITGDALDKEQNSHLNIAIYFIGEQKFH